MQQALVQTVQNQAPRHKYEDRGLEITWFAFGITIYFFLFSSLTVGFSKDSLNHHFLYFIWNQPEIALSNHAFAFWNHMCCARSKDLVLSRANLQAAASALGRGRTDTSPGWSMGPPDRYLTNETWWFHGNSLDLDRLVQITWWTVGLKRGDML